MPGIPMAALRRMHLNREAQDHARRLLADAANAIGGGGKTLAELAPLVAALEAFLARKEPS